MQQSAEVSLRVSSSSNRRSSQEGEGSSGGEHLGHWNQEQHARYVAYLEFNRERFRNRQMRRLNKFYKYMAQFIPSRTPLQCRSHHQKLQTKYRYLNRIISDYKHNHNLTLYQGFLVQLQRSRRQPKPPVPIVKKQQKQVEIQTQLAGVDIQYMYWEEYQQGLSQNSWASTSALKNSPHCKTQEQIFEPYRHFNPPKDHH